MTDTLRLREEPETVVSHEVTMLPLAHKMFVWCFVVCLEIVSHVA